MSTPVMYTTTLLTMFAISTKIAPPDNVHARNVHHHPYDVHTLRVSHRPKNGLHAPPPTHVCKPRQGRTGTSDRMARQPACRSCFLDRLPAAKTTGGPSRRISRAAVQTMGAAATAKLQGSSASLLRLGWSCFSRTEAQRARKDRGLEALQGSSERDSSRQQARGILNDGAPPQSHKHGPLTRITRLEGGYGAGLVPG